MGVLLDSLHSALALDPATQDHLLQARQMQALSFVVHIPIVCFAIAFPIMVVFVEWLYVRTGDEGVTLDREGILADVAPTALALLGIEQPAEMTGRSLLGQQP